MTSHKADRLQAQRFELKYIIPGDLALAVSDFVRSYLSLDEYGAAQPDRSYPVHSLYLDSDSFTLHQSTINGDKNRYKLRVRFYENRPGAPVYCEIKRRRNNTISKERGPVRREILPAVLAGHPPMASEMLSDDPRHAEALRAFCRHVTELNARPRVHVAYRREAWLTPRDNSVRVTFDRQVRSCPEPTISLSPDMKNPVMVFGGQVVLEIKFTGRFPPWVGEMVRVFGLRRTSAAKYVDGVVVMEERHILNQSYRPSGSGFCAENARVIRPSGQGFGKYVFPADV